MHVSVNLEFTDEELSQYAADLGRRWIVNALVDLGRAKFDPSWAAGIQSVLGSVFKPAPAAYGDAIADAIADAPPPPPWYGTPQPKECATLRATPFNDEAWICHLCSTCNGTQRSVCRNQECGHVRCGQIHAPGDTPPTPESSEPSGP